MPETKKPERLEELDVVRWQDGKIYVLGKYGSYSLWNNMRNHLQYSIHDAKTGEILQEDLFKENDEIFGQIALVLSFLGGAGIPWLIHELRPSVRERVKMTKHYEEMVEKFKERNMRDLREAIKHIRVYQGTVEEVSRDLGRELERVDTGRPATFLSESNLFDLIVEAHCVGADAVVHYQPGSSYGTPVRFKEVKE